MNIVVSLREVRMGGFWILESIGDFSSNYFDSIEGNLDGGD